MNLRTFSVVGEALNFGARRMETIMRVAWLPVVVLLVLNMASAFAILSVANDRFISFADLAAANVSYNRAVSIAFNALMAGLGARSVPMLIVFMLTVASNVILIASFLTPLIRFAGLGERPPPGVLKLAFGPDHVRYLIAGALSFMVGAAFIAAPIGGAAYWTLKYILDALSQVYVSFPDPESLHTIELVATEQVLAERGSLWFYRLGLPTAALAPFALIFWFILIGHFHPKNRAETAGAPNLLARGAVTLMALAGVVGIFWFWVLGRTDTKITDPTSAYLAMATIIFLIAMYFSLRVTPYPAVAVCRKSLAPGGTLSVTRGWNIVRLFAALLFTWLIIVVVQYLINTQAFAWMWWTLNFLYSATLSATKLTNSGDTAPWVLPLFAWIWNGVKIIVNIFWTFFSYGVWAGLQGRLYRESERIDV